MSRYQKKSAAPALLCPGQMKSALLPAPNPILYCIKIYYCDKGEHISNFQMTRRELPVLASKIARIISGTQCSTSTAAASLSALENISAHESIGRGLNAQSSFPFLFSVVDLRSRSFTRTFATAAANTATSDGLQISESAAARLAQLQKQAGERPVYLRLTVEGGGCSGFQYEFSLEDQGPLKGDQTFTTGNATVICDDVSMEFLRGATVDFESDLMRSAFVVSLNNLFGSNSTPFSQFK